MNECNTYEWVVSHIWMSRVTHMNESCHTYEWVVSHIWMSLTHMDTGQSCWECCRKEKKSRMNVRVTHEWVWQIWMCHVMHMNESNTHGYRPIMLGVLQKKNRGWMSVSHMDESDIHECIRSHIWMSCSHMNESCHAYEWVMSHIWMSHGTHMNESHTYGVALVSRID